jgi:transcriptional regulator with AAA-type ATPase domain
MSGALRLRFPKIAYKAQLKTGEEQTRVFYRLVDETVKSILDADYYARRKLSLAELEENPEFPEFADTTPYREVLSNPEARKLFFSGLDLGAPEYQWLPHVRAIDEMLSADAVGSGVAELAAGLAKRDPGQAVRLLSVCRLNAGLSHLGEVVFGVLRGEPQAMPAEIRAHAEETLLAWAIDHEEDGWDVDPESAVINARDLRWRVEDMSLEVLPAVLWKLASVLHARLKASNADVSADLRKYDWCMAAAKALPANYWRCPAALRLLATGRVPGSVQDATRILKEPVSDLRALDDAVLDQFGLPLWPRLSASRTEHGVVLSNEGVGAALAVAVIPAGTLFRGDAKSAPFDLLAGQSVSLPVSGSLTTIDLVFEKFGAQHLASLPVVASTSATADQANVRVLSATINRKWIEAQRAYRREIDGGNVVVGSSPSLLKVFEDIHHANTMEDGAAVLILGERGVGKTLIAKLLHDSSARAARPFKAVNAGGSGGDVNIQRGEWIGYGKGHGISGVEPKGKPGHLMAVDSGTLFVDEFVVLSQDLQTIFLSVLEKCGITRVGGETFTPDVRCVFATNANVEDAVERRLLRPDLLARIPVHIRIPPLRERRGDIILLAKHFAGVEYPFSDRCLLALVRHEWPDNVRELRSKVAAAVARKKTKGAASVDLAHLELPPAIVMAAQGLSDEDCRRELWQLADKIARDEGFAHGTGLQRRAGEIMGVGEPQASKMYQTLGLADAATA